MELKPGYQQTEVGVIPEDWDVSSIGRIAVVKVGKDVNEAHFSIINDQRFQYPVYSNTVSNKGFFGYYDYPEYTGDAVTIVGRGVGLGTAFSRSGSFGAIGRLVVIFPNMQHDSRFLADYINHKIDVFSESSGIPQLTGISISKYKIACPAKTEQTAIANALSDADALIQSLTSLIAKKRQIKQGAMQTLLNPYENGRLKAGWVVKKLGESMECLDNLRVPLNETQRNKMKGDIPYCGANGVLDYVNDYVVDSDIILMAEDGGYFDQYLYRPIAYRITGKCWVNNHAHILKALPENDQGYLFYSLVHKNILNYLASGTRAKLNKTEMEKIEIPIPIEKKEQTRIATILSDMDAEIAALEAKLAKYRHIKQGMMQNLLTGRIRLVQPDSNTGAVA